jgi:DNA-binding response OmpR family regulator
VACKRILLVEDDRFVASLTEAFLRHAYEVSVAHTAKEALEGTARRLPDLVLLDLGLPDEDGLVLARLLRTRSPDLPIIYVTSRNSKDDVLTGLDLGGDDYVTKPFDPDLLIARINAVLRRANGRAAQTAWLGVGNSEGRFDIDQDLRKVRTTDGDDVALTRAEFDLVVALANARGRILSRAQLLDAIAQGADRDVDERVIDALVSKIRRKLMVAGLAKVPVETVRGVGYRVSTD